MKQLYPAFKLCFRVSIQMQRRVLFGHTLCRRGFAGSPGDDAAGLYYLDRYTIGAEISSE